MEIIIKENQEELGNTAGKKAAALIMDSISRKGEAGTNAASTAASDRWLPAKLRSGRVPTSNWRGDRMRCVRWFETHIQFAGFLEMTAEGGRQQWERRFLPIYWWRAPARRE